jgi:hypothetical protein
VPGAVQERLELGQVLAVVLGAGLIEPLDGWGRALVDRRPSGEEPRPRSLERREHLRQREPAALDQRHRVDLVRVPPQLPVRAASDGRELGRGLLGPDPEVPEQVPHAPSVGGHVRPLRVLGSQPVDRVRQPPPPFGLALGQPFTFLEHQPSSGMNSNARSPITTSSPRRAPAATSWRSTPSRTSRFWSSTILRGSSKSVSATHRSTFRPTTR